MAVWAGLNAWSEPAPTWPEVDGEVAAPEPVEVNLEAFPKEPPRTVEASADLRSGARRPTGEVVAHLTGESVVGGPDRVALLDGETGAALGDRAVPDALPADIAWEGVPVGEHWVVTYREGDSPRRQYATRTRVVLDDAPGEPQVEVGLDVSTTRAVVLLELLEAPADRTWVPVTAVLTRPDDPQWAASPVPGTRSSFEPGSADVLLEFGELGPGRYTLRALGFEPQEPIEFELPGESVAFAVGRVDGR